MSGPIKIRETNAIVHRVHDWESKATLCGIPNPFSNITYTNSDHLVTCATCSDIIDAGSNGTLSDVRWVGDLPERYDIWRSKGCPSITLLVIDIIEERVIWFHLGNATEYADFGDSYDVRSDDITWFKGDYEFVRSDGMEWIKEERIRKAKERLSK